MDQRLTQAWAEELERVDRWLAPHVARIETRDYLRGLLSGADRKNGWQLAEEVGNATPYGVQHRLGRASRNADAVRDALRGYVTDHLADRDAVLVVAETGFLKKGAKSVGVKRQYSGTASRTITARPWVASAHVPNPEILPSERAGEEGCAPGPPPVTSTGASSGVTIHSYHTNYCTRRHS